MVRYLIAEGGANRVGTGRLAGFQGGLFLGSVGEGRPSFSLKQSGVGGGCYSQFCLGVLREVEGSCPGAARELLFGVGWWTQGAESEGP